jgi:hypothetical protein
MLFGCKSETLSDQAADTGTRRVNIEKNMPSWPQNKSLTGYRNLYKIDKTVHNFG